MSKPRPATATITTEGARELVGEIRQRCAQVARQAQHVQIDEEQIGLYAVSLPMLPARPIPPITDAADRRARAAYWLTLNAINYGSGWFPTLKKRPGKTGYWTISNGIRQRFDRKGPWSAAELAEIEQPEIAKVLKQDPDHELMGLFAESLRDFGRHLQADHKGSFEKLISSSRRSAVALVETLAAWDCFKDESTYGDLTVPFLKRAQLAAADLARADIVDYGDLDQLTMFADNLVPHVLRLDGILRFDPKLVKRIDREALIEHGSSEEVEIRACAVHAVELIVAASPGITAAEVDQLLWNRGQGRRYKASPRHRSRSTAY